MGKSHENQKIYVFTGVSVWGKQKEAMGWSDGSKKRKTTKYSTGKKNNSQ